MDKTHFIIKFSPESNLYYVKDNSEGNGTFVKLNEFLEVTKHWLVSFGDIHMQMATMT